MRIAGSLTGGYLRFVGERARWLNVSGWAESRGPGRVEVVAIGPEALVGALEMACMLGPLEALVDTLAVEAISRHVTAGFVVR
jgi:acylphosphatase